MQSTPLVSVVTPFYNTSTYLAECIESVLRQTYPNWDYLLVDNCSTDGSTAIAQEYAARFPDKIRFIRTNSFLSQVQNYNFALSCIGPDSKYCKMVQADDWIFPRCLSEMVEVAERYPSVGIVSAYELAGESVQLDGLPYSQSEVDGKEACRLYFLKDIYLFGTPTSLLLRSDVVRRRVPFYDERYAPFEDGHTCFDLLRDSNLGFVHQVSTFSRRENGSILSRILPYGLMLYFRLAAIVTHGRDFLSASEYDRCLRHAEKQYFRFLSRQACSMRRPAKDFWELHRGALATIDYVLGWRLLAKWIPRALLKNAWDELERREGADAIFTTVPSGLH